MLTKASRLTRSILPLPRADTLWMLQRVYLGRLREEYAHYPDATARETAILFPMAVLAIFLGILPKYTFHLMNGSIADVLSSMGHTLRTVTTLALGG